MKPKTNEPQDLQSLLTGCRLAIALGEQMHLGYKYGICIVPLWQKEYKIV